MKKASRDSLTTQLTQYEVTALAIYLLGGAARAIDTEDAAVKCHELAPQMFSWQKYAKQINLELVRVSLSDAKKAKNGGLVSGSGREGWRLSSRGLDWIRAHQTSGTQFVTPPERHGSGKAGSVDSVRRERERQRLFLSDAWLNWKQSGEIDGRAARELFRIDEYTTERMKAIKVARLRAVFDPSDEVSPFLQSAGERVLNENIHGR